jgi:hypothetical protein
MLKSEFKIGLFSAIFFRFRLSDLRVYPAGTKFFILQVPRYTFIHSWALRHTGCKMNCIIDCYFICIDHIFMNNIVPKTGLLTPSIFPPVDRPAK